MIAAALEDYDSGWREDAISTIIALSHAHQTFTADDLAKEIRKPPHCNMVGAAFSAARRAGLIEPVSYTTSVQTARRHGVVRTWRRKINEGVAA